MKRGRPSRTAHLVTLARAMADSGLSHVPNFSDPVARVFLNEKGKKSLAKFERIAREGKPSMQLEAARGMADNLALRTAAIDRAVREAVAIGARQLVILGAGYDGRAWRMPELAGMKVFEVDHPSTQADKRMHVPELPRPIGEISFVAIDFEHESIDEALDRAGHDSSVPTCWIWEGVVMYLTHDAMRATLAGIAGRSASGSTLIVNYHAVRRGIIGQLIFRLIGEPQISHWTPDEMATDLAAAGMRVVDDSGMVDWNNQFAEGKARAVQRSAYMRIAVARVR